VTDSADSSDGSSPKGKKTYVKPEFKQVPLRPEEAVLGFCKTAGGGGPGDSCASLLCREVGS